MSNDELLTTCAHPAGNDHSVSAIPPIIPRYKCLEILGSGGMGVVWRAWDETLNRAVALKVVKSVKQRELVERFAREAKLVANVHHPHVVTVYDANFEGENTEFYFIVMEILSGGDVGTLLKRGPVTWQEAVRITKQAAQGLSAAHQSGIIHRDVKPANLLLDKSGAVKLADFGLSRPLELEGQQRSQRTIVGTPAYMPPEQAQGHVVDCRSDLYALGAVLFQLATGNVPYPQASTAVEALEAHCHQPIPSIRRTKPDLPEDLEMVVTKLMAKEPNDRYQTADELVVALEALEIKYAPKLEIWQQYPRMFYSIIALLLVMLCLLVFFASRKATEKPDQMAIFASEVSAIPEPSERVARVIAELKRLNPTLDEGSIKVTQQSIYGETGYAISLEKGTRLSNWGPVRALRNDLVALVAQDCGLSNVESLAECRRLKVLDLSYTGELKSLDSLKALNLSELYLRDTGVDSLEFLRGKNSLKILVAIKCPLTFDHFLPLQGSGLNKLVLSLEGDDVLKLKDAFPHVELIVF